MRFEPDDGVFDVEDLLKPAGHPLIKFFVGLDLDAFDVRAVPE